MFRSFAGSLFAASAALLLSAATLRAAPADSATVRGWQTGALRPDRLQHASLAFSIATGVGFGADSPAAGAAAALTLGVAKEVLDRRTTRFDWSDLLADAAGAALGAWLVAAVRP